MATANDVLNKARGELGYSRWTDPQAGTKYGRWYAQKTGVAYYGQSGVPYCAMFVSWVFAQVGASCAGLPGPYCPSMLAAGRSAGRAVPVTSAQPGDVVYFDWGRDGVADHVGLVEANNGSYLTCIEGNTSPGTSGSQSNGGGVYRRTRAYSTVAGVVRPAYAAPSKPASAKLDVDGIFGKLSVHRFCEVMKTPLDNIISSQSAYWRSKFPALTSVEWKSNGFKGSQLIAATQRAMGLKDDGLAGIDWIRGIEKRLGTKHDDVFGADDARALQARLNEGRF